MLSELQNKAKAAKAASRKMALATTEQKNEALHALIDHIHMEKERLLEANRCDIAHAKLQGYSESLIERLSLENRLEGIMHAISEVIRLEDPIGESFETVTLANQLKLSKCRTPIGVLGVIYESRPNVTVDITALAIKSGNCAILRGGSETLNTNRLFLELIQKSLRKASLPEEAIQCLLSGDRSEVKTLLQMHESIDLIIPRGNAALQQFCKENSTIPVITGGIGICHLFVDESADIERSIQVIFNAKTQRPTVCNALDTLLVHRAVASHVIPRVVNALRKGGVVFRLDPNAFEYVQDPSCTLAVESDWNTEWLSLVLGIKVVEDIFEAIDHIHQHSSGHSDGILTENALNAELFVKAIDSAAVYINASTRFTDGGQFGLGAEVAISTQKLHARGPMGLKELTSYRWIIRGQYHCRT